MTPKMPLFTVTLMDLSEKERFVSWTFLGTHGGLFLIKNDQRLLLGCPNLQFLNPMSWKFSRSLCEKLACIDAHSIGEYGPQFIVFELFVI